MLRNGQKVSMEYTVSLVDGTEVDTNVGDEPLVFIFGEHQVFPALEEALEDLVVGGTKTIVLSPDEAYGPVVPDAFREVDLDAVPQKFRFAGAVLGIQDPAGGVFPIRVHAISEEKAVLDFNHPLAGKPLQFDVKIIQAD